LKFILDPGDQVIIVIGNNFKKPLGAGHHTLLTTIALTAIDGDVIFPGTIGIAVVSYVTHLGETCFEIA
jgi:hypothetical protein